MFLTGFQMETISIDKLILILKTTMSYFIFICLLEYQASIKNLIKIKMRVVWFLFFMTFNITYWGMPAFTTLKNTPGEMKIVYKMIKYCLTGKKEDAASVGNQNV